MRDKFIEWLYGHSFGIGKKLVRSMLISNTKAECESELIRKIWKDKYDIDVGMYTYGCFEESMFANGTIIGRYCSIAKQVKHLNANHPLDSVCMTPYFYNKSLGFQVEDVARSSLQIGNDVWIGYRVIILPNCHHIGNGAVIGSGSVVTRDVPPYAVVAGAPAKIIRYRFSEEICEKLEDVIWWKIPPEVLVKYIDSMSSPTQFCEELESGI